ncbi:MAG: 50S ribosomal protein L33 [Parcubacteria group bacterium]
MSQDNLVKLECKDCRQVNYYTKRNKKAVKQKLEMKKYCKHCRKHTPHKEIK